MSDEATVGDLGELGVIALIDRIVGQPEGVVGIGDDTAAVPCPPGQQLLATTDSLVQDIHFRLEPDAAVRVGQKALAVNLSDIAAMGGSPRYALVSLVTPPQTPVAFVRDLYAGLTRMADRFGVTIVGGNLSASAGPVVVDITVLGHAPSGEIILRSGARVGDVIVVSGVLGGAAAGRRLVEAGLARESAVPVPEPRVEAGRRLAAGGIPTAMIDVSDGLATDARHLAEASGVGFVLYAADIPIAVAARRAGREIGERPLDIALYGGEDYELLMTMPDDRFPAAVRAAGEVPLARIGTVLGKEHGILLEEIGGDRIPLTAAGWEHFRSA